MAEPASPTSLFVLPSTGQPPSEPPPPYTTSPHRSRRNRRLGTRVPSDSVADCEAPTRSQRSRHGPVGQDVSDDETATENTPLLSTPLLRRRQRTVSHSSTVRSTISGSPSFAQTLISAFQPELDSDIDLSIASPVQDERRHLCRRREVSESSVEGLDQHVERLDLWPRIKRYFRPMGRKAYYSAVFHLLVLNFPFALLAWVYLFVFTLTGTTLLVVLPLGALLCFLDLLGARAFSRAELALQSTFHGPLASVPYPPRPIFYRLQHAVFDAESGVSAEYDGSFYRNSYAMFTDATTYQSLFYFLVIKPGITVLLGISLIILVPVSFVFVLPAPAMLRVTRRLGIWQANVAVEGLYFAVR